MGRRAGLAAVAGAVMAVVGNSVVGLADPAVTDDQVSYPLSSGAFDAGQVWFALTQALMAVGVLGLARSSLVSAGRGRTAFGTIAWVGMAVTVPGELVLIAVASKDVDSAAASAASTVFGVGILLASVGLIGLGVLALRQRHWALPWRALPLAYGVFQLLVVTPVSLSLGFASVASYVVIAVSDALMALMGAALVREPVTDESAALARSVGA